MNDSIRLAPSGFSSPLFLLLIAVIGGASGCTSVLTSASLRDLVWDDEHAAEAAEDAADEPADDAEHENATVTADSSAEPSFEADAQRREAAVEEATARLAKLGHLDDAARATLVETLDRTEPEDWPAVIEAFAATLADVQPPRAAASIEPPTDAEPPTDPQASADTEAAAETGDSHVVAKAALDATTQPPAPKPEPEADAPAPPEPADAEPSAGVAIAEPATPTTQPATPAASVNPERPAADAAEALSPPTPPLVIQNACFATRVQAWGVVDRFPADRFRPGQEVIVYFELDGLSAGESPTGYTTCIDATLRLVATDGRVLHDWGFEPIAETCRARRHDYFARYVVRLPEAAADGACRIELAVTDTLSGERATASLPLTIEAGVAAR